MDINGVEVSFVDAVRQIASELEESSGEKVINDCHAKVATFFNTLGALEVDVQAKLKSLLEEGGTVSAPRQNASALSRDEIMQLLSGIMPPLVVAAKKWGDIRTVDTLEQLADRLQAFLGDKE